MRASLIIAMAIATNIAHAQQGSAVYRCVSEGRTSYSHAPCKNGVEVDVTPTRGADQFSGVSRKSAQAQREDVHEKIMEAIGQPPVRKLSISKP